MEYQPYIPGFTPVDSGPLTRFLPPLDEGVVSAWLSHQSLSGNWLLDPFGFSPQLILEAARSGYCILVTANNPITRFLIEIYSNPPPESEFIAGLADLGATKKGEERFAAYLQSLYRTTCESCKQPVQARSYLWRKGEETPYARQYDCPVCGHSAEQTTTGEDQALAKQIAATDVLHRSRALERVVSLKDRDRIYAEEAIQHYLPRPLYVLTTIINRLDSLTALSPARKRALMALLLFACDAGNTLWAYPSERPRPKLLSTPGQFREHNIWLMLEHGIRSFTGSRLPVACETWPNKIPESGGICIFEGRLKDLAFLVKKEIPISAVVGSVPRPNQAFWTLSALWAGWLWGREAVEPYKAALRRRRYDWAWNATALHSIFTHLKGLLGDNVPVFGLIPEPEPAFLTSAFSAAHTAGFKLESIALRTEHDIVQVEWSSAQPALAAPMEKEILHKALRDYIAARGEPASYLHLHTAGLTALGETGAMKQPGNEFDETLREIHAAISSVLKEEQSFVHYSTGGHVETGVWGLGPRTEAHAGASLSDQVEMAIVGYLQKNPNTLFLDLEADLYPRFPGLMTPSQGLIYAVLNSYAEKNGAVWRLRDEDAAASRRREMAVMFQILRKIGERLEFQSDLQGKVLLWKDQDRVIKRFHVLASALLHRALEQAKEQDIMVIPGGRSALAAYKLQRDPSLKARMQTHQLVKYRLLRRLADMPIVTRESLDEQIFSDPVEESHGQLLMF